jgi:hypothetical protein
MIRSYTTLCDSAIAALGEGAYRAVFSIVSLAVIVWLVMAYKYAPYVATWGILESFVADAAKDFRLQNV